MCAVSRVAEEGSGLVGFRLLLCRVVVWVGGSVMLVLRHRRLLQWRLGLVVMLYFWRFWLGLGRRLGHLEVGWRGNCHGKL